MDTFCDIFSKSDKKTYKENLGQFFGTSDTVIDYVNIDPLPKWEDKPADKWNEIIKGMTAEEGPTHNFRALSAKDDGTLISAEQVLIEQLKNKPGGQLVECTPVSADGGTKIVLCELPSENWAIVHVSE